MLKGGQIGGGVGQGTNPSIHFITKAGILETSGGGGGGCDGGRVLQEVGGGAWEAGGIQLLYLGGGRLKVNL